MMEGLLNAGGLHKSVEKPRPSGVALHVSIKIDLQCSPENKTRIE